MSYVIDWKVITCASRGTCQKVKAAEKGITARLCVKIDGKDLWLSAFTDVMKFLIDKVFIDEIKAGLIGLENITIVIDSTSNIILDV